jgi:hypothetical protein
MVIVRKQVLVELLEIGLKSDLVELLVSLQVEDLVWQMETVLKQVLVELLVIGLKSDLAELLVFLLVVDLV